MGRKLLGSISLIIGLLLFCGLLIDFILNIITLKHEALILLLLGSQVMMSLGIILLSYFDDKLSGKVFCVFFVLSLMFLMLAFLESTTSYYYLFEIFLVLAIILGLSHRPHEIEFIPHLDNVSYILGKSFKALATGLFIYWILAKIGLLKYLVELFGNIDTILIYVFTAYVMGVAFTEFGSSIVYGNISQAIRSSIFSVFFALLILSIVSYFLITFNIVGSQWIIFNGMLWRMTLMFFIASILALFLLEGPTYLVSEKTLGDVKPSSETYEVEKTSSTFIGESVELLVKSGSIAIPLKRKQDYTGYFISGDISYTIELDGYKLSGEANNLCIISQDSYIYDYIKHELKLKQSFHEYTMKKILLRELTREIEETLAKIRSILRRKHKVDIVRLPFIKVVSGESYDYVKIGPLVVVDTKDGSYVSFGPFGIYDYEERRKRTQVREIILLLSDITRGDIVIKMENGTLSLYQGNLFIQKTPQRIVIKRGRVYYKKTPEQISLKWGKTLIKIVNKSLAKISFNGVAIEVNRVSIKIFKHGNVWVVQNTESAEKLLSLLEEYLKRIPRDIIKGTHLETITKLLRTIEDLIVEMK